MGSRKQTSPKGLCAYFVESRESDGSTSVAEEVTFLVKKCIVDKIFSKSSDEISMCRSDSTSSVTFVASNWDGLRKGLGILEEKRSSETGILNPLESLDDVVNALIAQSNEDTYEDKKIIYFANLSSYILGEKELTKLAEKLRVNDVFISIILPDKIDRSEIQQQNSKLIENVFNQEEYDNVSIITTMQKARVQILNTQSKESIKPTAWNVLFEVTPEIVINVGGYTCTRKNAISDMKRALIKEAEGSRVTDSARASAQSASADQSNPVASSSNNSRIATNGSAEKTVVVEPAKEALEKEIIFKENDGTTISQDDIGKGYYFGDKLIPYNDLETEGSYRSGAKCLRLLAFCPKERISTTFHAGDGITLFYPKKDDSVSEVKFKALMKAMTNTDRIAIVRRIYRKDSRVTIGTLIPDDDRQCLVFTELCFADDVSVPQFPVLIKPEELEDEGDEMNVEVSEKEYLIDELIRMKTVDSFNPGEGPSDPAVKNLREAITKKIITDRPLDEEIKKIDNIDIFFQSLVASDEDELYEKLRNGFPLKENVKGSERFAGQNIFKKRSADDMPEADAEKRVKIDEPSLIENEANVEMEIENELDDLLDEL